MITRSPGGHPKNRLQITPVNPGVCPFKNQEKTMITTSCAASPTVSDSIRGTVQWLQTLFLIRLNQCLHWELSLCSAEPEQET